MSGAGPRTEERFLLKRLVADSVVEVGDAPRYGR
jgi:hypothetical protein